MYAVRRAYPNAHLTLMTSPGQKGLPGAWELLAEATWIDEVIVYYPVDLHTPQSWIKLIRNLRNQHYDICLELPSNLTRVRSAVRNMFIAFLTGVKWAYGWRISTIRWLAQTQSEQIEFPNEVDRLLAILHSIGIDTTGSTFPLPIGAAHQKGIDNLLEAKGILKQRLIAIAPGAKRTTNIWPADRFSAVGQAFIRRGFQVIVLGGQSDRTLCQQVADGIGSGGHNLAGQTSLLDSCELLKRCRLVIANDSGVQHLATSVNTPCISLFSYRDIKGKWRPYGPQNVVLQKWVECHTCFLPTCPYENRCIKLIDTLEVIAAAEELLGRS